MNRKMRDADCKASGILMTGMKRGRNYFHRDRSQ